MSSSFSKISNEYQDLLTALDEVPPECKGILGPKLACLEELTEPFEKIEHNQYMREDPMLLGMFELLKMQYDALVKACRADIINAKFEAIALGAHRES